MKKFLVLIIGVLMSVVVFAHAPLISIDDNGDGTVYIEGGFSNGASAEGVEIIIVKDNLKEKVVQQRRPGDSSWRESLLYFAGISFEKLLVRQTDFFAVRIQLRDIRFVRDCPDKFVAG